MPIEINNTLSVIKGGSNNVSDQSSAAQSPSPDNTSSTANDTVVFTDAASRLHELEKEVASLPVLDAQKVEQVQSVISKENYSVNFQQVAEKVIGFESALNTVRA